MRYRKCPGLKKKWSVITLGCWQLAPSGGWGDLCSKRTATSVIKNALDYGITAFDTAEGYGDGESERRLSKALGNQKDDVIIISKIWPDAPLTLKGYMKRLDQTLLALKRDYVDVYLVHWPMARFRSAANSKKLADIMLEIKASGKATSIGVSNFGSEDLKRLGKSVSAFDINQIPYSLLDRQYEGHTLKASQKHGLHYMAYAPTAKGLLARMMKDKDFQFPARKNNKLFSKTIYPKALKVFEVVQTVAKEKGILPIEVALAWVITQNNILTAVVGSRKPSQVQAFAKAGDCRLSKKDLKRLDAASDAFLRDLGIML